MRKLFYNLYAVFFNAYRLFPVNSKKVTFISMHKANWNDSLGEVRGELERQGGYKILSLSRCDFEVARGQGIGTFISSFFKALSFFTVKAYGMATSKYIFLNDNFMPMAKLNISKKTIVTQLWHGDGAFKKIGLDIELPKKIRQYELAGYSKLTYAVCSSHFVREIYANAFNLPVENVLPLGSARTDYFFRDNNKTEIRKKFDEHYPQCRGKELVLYAPTFREKPEDNEKILQNFYINLFNEHLSSQYALLIRLHPQIKPKKQDLQGVINLTDYPNINELLLLADILITDYSSVIMDFAHLSKPMIFFPYDLEVYKKQRNVYFEYEEYVPGIIVKTQEEMLAALEKRQFNISKIPEFLEKNFDYRDGKASKRIIDFIIKDKKY